MNITKQTLNEYKARFEGDRTHPILANAVAKNGIQAAAVDVNLPRRMQYVFSNEVQTGEITDQKSSGRCWMFAALNTMRVETMRKLNVESFEFSQNYPLFWDKMEKSNYFLESILETLDEPLEGRLVSHLLTAPLQDGGQWDMFSGLVKKYGVVPKEQMPETYHSSNTRMMNKFLTLKLREFACVLREAHAAGDAMEALRSRKDEMLYTIYHILCLALGTPPETFDFEYTDKDKVFHRDLALTPQSFFEKYVGWNLEDKISLIHAPTKDKPYGRAYTVKYLGSVKEGTSICYINVPIEVLKAAAIAQLKDNLPVWFGCDVGQMKDEDQGAMDMRSHDFEGLLGTEFKMTKAQRLDYHESVLTHAMVFLGVNLDEEGKPNRWKVENSWSEKRGKKGFYIMSDDWFDEYNYQIMVDKKYIPKQWLSALEQPIIELEPWDPMGSLAMVR